MPKFKNVETCVYIYTYSCTTGIGTTIAQDKLLQLGRMPKLINSLRLQNIFPITDPRMKSHLYEFNINFINCTIVHYICCLKHCVRMHAAVVVGNIHTLNK